MPDSASYVYVRSASLARFFALAVSLLLCALASGCFGPPAFIPDASHGFLQRRESEAAGQHRFYIYRPINHDPKQKLPVILYLHGGGERGFDGVAPTQVGLGQAVQRTLGYFPFIVVFPQCAPGRFWAMPDMAARAMAALETAIRDFNGDRERVYVTGNSMGGFGTWYLAARHPGRFAALAPICGGVRPPRWVKVPKEERLIDLDGDPYLSMAQKIGRTPVWIFHGSEDPLVPIEESRRMEAALRRTGGIVRYTEWPGVGHNAEQPTYDNPELYSWLLRQRLGAPTPEPDAPASPVLSALPVRRTYDITELMNGERLADASFSADGQRVLVSSNRSGIWNVYALPAGGGAAVPLTQSTRESTYAVAYFPHDDRFLYTHDRGGNEFSHLYVRDHHEERDLTPGDHVKATFLRFNARGDAFYYFSNARDQRYFDVYRMDTATLVPRLCFKNDQALVPVDVSPDERYLALLKNNTRLDSDAYLYDLRQQQLARIAPPKDKAAARYEPQIFDPHSRHLYLLTNADSEFKYVVRYDLRTRKLSPVARADWDAMSVRFSPRGTYRVIAWNEDAHTRVAITRAVNGAPVQLPPLPAGDLTDVAFADSEQQMAFYLEHDRAPRDLFLYDFRTQKVQQLTHALGSVIQADDLVASEVVRFRSFDGLPIPNLLYRPPDATSAHKAPAVIYVHGGPGDQTRAVYTPLFQYLVNHGYVVLGINNRGSAGYGKTFYSADDRRHGREPLWDCAAAKQYLASLGYVDPERIGILGRSYGGYMVLAALTFLPETFAVGVDLFGVANWARTLKGLPTHWASTRHMLYQEIGDPETQAQQLHDISPLFYADRIRRPLMVLQGANDIRVLQTESDDIVATARRSGVPVEYIVFANEGHGFTKRENESRGNQAILEFLDKYLKNGRPGRPG